MEKVYSCISLKKKQRAKLVILPGDKSLLGKKAKQRLSPYLQKQNVRMNSEKSEIKRLHSQRYMSPISKPAVPQKVIPRSKVGFQEPVSDRVNYSNIYNAYSSSNNSSHKLPMEVKAKYEKLMQRLRTNFKFNIERYKQMMRETPSWTNREEILPKSSRRKKSKEDDFEIKGWD
jgi:hypothetical protein